MNKYFTQGLLTTFIFTIPFVFGVTILATPASAADNATCNLLESLIKGGVFQAGKEADARKAFGCTTPSVVNSVQDTRSIVVTSPSGQDFWSIDSNKTITWQPIGLSQVTQKLYNISAVPQVTCAAGQTCVSSPIRIATSVGADNSYIWPVGVGANQTSVSGGQYKINICLVTTSDSASDQVCGISQIFTIGSASQAPTQNTSVLTNPISTPVAATSFSCAKGNWAGKANQLGLWIKSTGAVWGDERFICDGKTNDLFYCTVTGNSDWNKFSTRATTAKVVGNYRCNGTAWVPTTSPASCEFDARKYADSYSDLKAAFGYNTASLRNHWLSFGMNEGRSPCGTGAVVNPGASSNATSNRTYKVEYNGNEKTGGTVPADAEYATGATVTVSANTGNLVKNGRTFAGWNTRANGTGTNYQPGDVFGIGTEKIVLYARWATGGERTCTSYDYSAWSACVNGTKTRNITKSTPSGCIGGATPLISNSCTVVTHQLIYNGNGKNSGSVPITASGYAENEIITAPSNTGNMVKKNKTFIGWNTRSNGNGTTYKPGDTFGMPGEKLILYAVWQ